jgi:V8-like Glu-specific endopeptidase
MYEKYKPNTPVEKATLAVVAIETPAAKGSGFFVSSRGHIVTNKHVIRPAESTQWKQSEDTLTAQRQELDAARRELSTSKNWLTNMERKIKSYKPSNSNFMDSDERIAEAQYRRNVNAYQPRKKEYERYRKVYKEEKAKYDKANSAYRSMAFTARSATQFKVILKDETVLNATLVELSEAHDLALLKLDGYTTPYLIEADLQSVGQGSKVYAIGNPLGLRDYVTSGIITSIKDDAFVTDTQVLPGNSGGPLIDEAGQLLGINTVVLSAGMLGSEMFGAAISSTVMMDQFSRHITIVEDQ